MTATLPASTTALSTLQRQRMKTNVIVCWNCKVRTTLWSGVHRHVGSAGETIARSSTGPFAVQCVCCSLRQGCPYRGVVQASTQGLVRALQRRGEAQGARVLCPVPLVTGGLTEPQVIPRFLASLQVGPHTPDCLPETSLLWLLTVSAAWHESALHS